MSKSSGTQSRSSSTEQVTRDGYSPPSDELAVTTRLLNAEPEPFPYTRIRDWVALLGQNDLSDGAYRLYCISRSVIWENVKGGPPPRPYVEITYEEYAAILGRSARTISRFADDLYRTGLWEEVERSSRSVRLPGKRPQVQTVITIRVHDSPREPWSFDGPTKTWDVLSSIRAARRGATADHDVSPGRTATTDLSGQCDQDEQRQPTSDDRSAPPVAGEQPAADAVCADGTATTDLSGQRDQDELDDPFGPDADEDQPHVLSPAQTAEQARQCARTDLSAAMTDLSDHAEVSAGQSMREGALKKTRDKEQPSLPPAPSAAATAAGHEQGSQSLAEELAMFSADAVELVTQLYSRALTVDGAQALAPAERIGLARRIDTRLSEGWSLNRVRAVLNGGSLIGVKMPGRMWAKRLDDMPAFPAGAAVPAQRAPRIEGGADHTGPRPSMRGSTPTRRGARLHVNDCSDLPEPNPGKVRYEIPDDLGRRMTVVWADDRTVLPWCGRCSADSRCLRPTEPGALLRPCLKCHPDPDAFPPLPEPAVTADAASAGSAT